MPVAILNLKLGQQYFEAGHPHPIQFHMGIRFADKWVKEGSKGADETTLVLIKEGECEETRAEEGEGEPFFILAGPGLVGELAEGRLHDVWLRTLGLGEVTRQHYTIPVLADEAVIELMDKAIKSTWPNDYKGIWYDILSQSKRGRDISRTERTFTVIIRGVEQKQYWPTGIKPKRIL